MFAGLAFGTIFFKYVLQSWCHFLLHFWSRYGQAALLKIVLPCEQEHNLHRSLPPQFDTFL